MSSVVVLQTYDRLWIGSDSAVSAQIGGVTYRWHENGQKLWVVDDSVIFCSGRAELAEDVMEDFLSTPIRTLERLQEIAIKRHEAYMKKYDETFEVGVELFLTILVCKYEHGKTVVYGLEPHDGFKLTARILDNPSNFAIWSGGIKVDESAKAAMTKFRETMNVVQTFQHAFDEISYEGIGGELTVYEIDKGDVKPFMHTRVKEKRGLKRLTDRIVKAELKRLRAEMVSAEVVAGQLGNFVSMVIGNGNDVTKINTNGISAGHDDFNSAPFRVNHQGDVVARSIKLTGEVSQSDVISSVIRASKIIGNEIEGGTITGSRIQTDTDTRRIVLDAEGFRSSDGSGRTRISIDTNDNFGTQEMRYYGPSGSKSGVVSGSDGQLNVAATPPANLVLAGSTIVLGGDAEVEDFPVTDTVAIGSGVTQFDFSNVPIVNCTEIDAINSQISALWSALAGKASTSHSHTVSLGTHNHGIAGAVNWGGTFTAS